MAIHARRIARYKVLRCRCPGQLALGEGNNQGLLHPRARSRCRSSHGIQIHLSFPVLRCLMDIMPSAAAAGKLKQSSIRSPVPAATSTARRLSPLKSGKRAEYSPSVNIFVRMLNLLSYCQGCAAAAAPSVRRGTAPRLGSSAAKSLAPARKGCRASLPPAPRAPSPPSPRRGVAFSVVRCRLCVGSGSGLRWLCCPGRSRRCALRRAASVRGGARRAHGYPGGGGRGAPFLPPLQAVSVRLAARSPAAGDVPPSAAEQPLKRLQAGTLPRPGWCRTLPRPASEAPLPPLRGGANRKRPPLGCRFSADSPFFSDCPLSRTLQQS